LRESKDLGGPRGITARLARIRIPKSERPMLSHGPRGGLVGINQEVVTLTWPLRHNSGPDAT